MAPGPQKHFDPTQALDRARDLFWRNGYDGTGISELEAALGIGRKSLYDTFGPKRALFLRALERYADTVIQSICDGLERPASAPLENLARVLERLQHHHGSGQSRGCLLGVAMAQAAPDDVELAAVLRSYLGRLERAFERALQRARADGEVRANVRPKDVARTLVALTQGMALLGRIEADSGTTPSRSIVRAVLQGLRA